MRGVGEEEASATQRRLPNDWRSAAKPQGSAATEGFVSCNGRVRQQGLAFNSFSDDAEAYGRCNHAYGRAAGSELNGESGCWLSTDSTYANNDGL